MKKDRKRRAIASLDTRDEGEEDEGEEKAKEKQTKKAPAKTKASSKKEKEKFIVDDSRTRRPLPSTIIVSNIRYLFVCSM